MAPGARARGLSKRYGKVTALADLDLDLGPGEVLGYLGPNGAGKTTTIRLLLGFIQPTAGRAEIFGVDCQLNPDIVHRRVAFVPAESSLWPSLTGAGTLHLLGRLHGQADSSYRDELIARFDLDPSKKVRAYSRGNRQKVLLISALMTRADLLILDEPTSGLDPLMEVTFRRCVIEARERGQAVFLSSHVLSEAFGSAMSWSQPDGLIDALWIDSASKAIFQAIDAGAQALPDTIRTARKGYTAWSRTFQYAAAKPLKGGAVMLGLAVAPEGDLEAAKNESWSERLKSRVRVDARDSLGERLPALLRTAWSRS